MLDRSALKGFLPLVATPCYGGMVCINYAEAILALQKACAAEAYPIEFHLRRGDSLVTRCRNDCVAIFLANSRFTHLFFIDADIGFIPAISPPRFAPHCHRRSARRRASACTSPGSRT